MRETFHRFFAYFRVEHALVLVPVFGFAVYDSVFSAFWATRIPMCRARWCRWCSRYRPW